MKKKEYRESLLLRHFPQNADIKHLPKGKRKFLDNLDNVDGIAPGGCEIPEAMNNENVLIKMPRISSGKKWFVEFWYRDSIAVPLKRYKLTKGFVKHKTEKQKLAFAQQLAHHYTELLKSGWKPEADRSVVFFENNSVEKFASQKEEKYNIEFYIRLYFKTKKSELRDKSISTYKTKLNSFIDWLKVKQYHNLVPKQFTRQMAQQYMDHVRTKVKNNLTYNSYLERVMGAFTWMINHSEAILEVNPWTRIPKLIYASESKRPFNKEQREHIFNKLKEKKEFKLLLACKLIYQTFIRPGRELHGLQVEDFDLVTPMLWIPPDIAKNKKNLPVPLPAEIVIELKKLKLERYPGHFFVFGINDKISKKHAGRDHYSKRFTKFIRELGYGKEYTIYSWKHTGNQVAHANGMPLEKQRRLNRHQSLDETQTYLSGLAPLGGEEMGDYFKD